MSAFNELKSKRPDVLYVIAGPLMFAQRERMWRWRTVSAKPPCPAAFIDRILRGASPGALPIEQPTRFELMLNLRTAKAQWRRREEGEEASWEGVPNS